MIWGIVPAWAKETSKALITARFESVREKRSFKCSFTKRRSLARADGFYEWERRGKDPHLFPFNGGASFAVAGLGDQGDDMPRCCMLNATGNAVLASIHDRMLVIVGREDWEELMGASAIEDSVRVPSWRGDLMQDHEKMACRADRGQSRGKETGFDAFETLFFSRR